MGGIWPFDSAFSYIRPYPTAGGPSPLLIEADQQLGMRKDTATPVYRRCLGQERNRGKGGDYRVGY